MQTYKEFDVFIVFDECWDKTIELVEKQNYKFNITKLIREKKEGLAYAKNFGLKYITSDRVCFLDADDLYMPNKIEKQVNYLKTNDVDFLGTQAWNRYGNNMEFKESIFKLGQYETHEQISERLKVENIMTHGSMMIKKSCLDELGGYNHVKGMEDWDLWNRAIDKGYKFYQIQERLYIYTIGTSVAR